MKYLLSQLRKRWGMATNGRGRAGELSFSHFPDSKAVPWQALGTLMCSRDSEHRAHPRWAGGGWFAGGGSDPSSGGGSELWGSLEHLEALQKRLSWFTSCSKGSWMPGLFSSCYSSFVTCPSVPLAWDNLGEPFDISWALFTVNIKSLALTRQRLLLWLLE